MKKSSKRFVLSTEALNNRGFKVRTAGIKTDQFEKNPVLLWMHKRPKGESKNEVLPLGNFTELQTEGNELSGIPLFDDTDDFALSIFNKVENGTIRMGSPGLLPLKWKIVEGQKWLWESDLKEATLCDIGSNNDALAVALYNENEEVITLSDEYFKQVLTKKPIDMETIKLSEGASKVLNLSAESTPDEQAQAIENLVTLSESQDKKIVKLTADHTAEVKAKEEAEQKLADHVKEADEAKIVALMDKAVEDRKITPDQKENLIELADGNIEKLEKHIDSLEPQEEVAEHLKDAGGKQVNLADKSYKEIEAMPGNALVQLRDTNEPLFLQKYKEHYGKDYPHSKS